MIKLIETIKRKKGTTHEQFIEYWSKKHAPVIVKNIPNLVRYVQNYPIKLDVNKEAPYDGIAELWFESVESWKASRDWYLAGTNHAVHQSELNFCENEITTRFLCNEREFLIP